MMQHKSGSVLLMALVMMTLITVLTQQLVRSVFVGTLFDKAMVQREQVEMLALSGVNIAIAQLTHHEYDKQEKQPETGADAGKSVEGEKQKKFLNTILPFMNRWQKFDLTQEREGCTGTIKVCLCAEEGKINLNELFDFEKGEFAKPFDKLISSITVGSDKDKLDLLRLLTEFFKKRKKKLEDISQLTAIRELKSVDLFYTPVDGVLTPEEKKKQDEELKTRPLALADLFTVSSGKKTLNPLYLSDGLCALLGFGRVQPYTDEEKMKESFKNWTERFDPKWASEWPSNLNHLEQIYTTVPNDVNDVKEILAREIEPTVYSVLSFGIANGVEQKLLALIERTQVPLKENDKADVKRESSDKKEQKNGTAITYKIVKLYWI